MYSCYIVHHHIDVGDIEEILHKFSLLEHDPSASHSRRDRREFHGDRNQVRFDSNMVNSWKEEFRERVSRDGVCKAMVDKYDDAVAKYGYSLRDLKMVEPTPFILKHLLHTHRGEDSN